MMYLITSGNKPFYGKDLFEYHRLRKKVFVDGYGWDAPTQGNIEIDAFDHEETVYLIYKDFQRITKGGLRLVPTNTPHMLGSVFKKYISKEAYTASARVWECSRFFVDHEALIENKDTSGAKKATYELLIAMCEFALSWGIDEIVTPSEIRMERLLRMMGWPMDRISDPQDMGDCTLVSAVLKPSVEILRTLREKAKRDGPVLWGAFPLRYQKGVA